MATTVNHSKPIEWNYYFNDVWNDYTDYRVSQLPIVGSGPWLILSLMIVALTYTFRVSSAMDTRRRAYFMKPFQIVYYGFFFGIHGIAFPIILSLARSLNTTVSCNFNDHFDSDLRGIIFIYTSLLYLLVKMANFFDLSVLLWTKASNQFTFGLLMETILYPFATYAALKYYPGGLVFFPLLVDSFVNAIKYGLLTRAVASESIKPISNWERKIHYSKVIEYLTLTGHSIYTLSLPDCDCPISLRYFFTSIYLTIGLAYTLSPGHSANLDQSRSSKSNSNPTKAD